jgi:hypothetical protein
VTKVEFLVAYPEFVVIDSEEPTLVQAVLDEADKAVSDQWGDKRDEIHGLETAHRLALKPSGRNAKLSTRMGKSSYGEQLKERRRAFGCALNRLG